MNTDNKPYGIVHNWDTEYLCKNCGELLYYDIETKETHCFNPECINYPAGIDIFSVEEADLTFVKQQYTEVETKIGQIVKTFDFSFLSRLLLERRRRLVERFFLSGIMCIDDFLLANDVLFFIQRYKSIGIRQDIFTLRGFLQLFKKFSEQQQLLEDLEEGRLILAKNPENKIFRLKYFDIMVGEIWDSYGLVNLQSPADAEGFRYHEIIQKIVEEQRSDIFTDYAPYFERFWPLAVSFQYLVKKNHSTSLKYRYSVTPTDLVNILSIIMRLKNNQLITVPIMNLLQHFIQQPMRDRSFIDFIDILSGSNDKIPMVFKTDGNIILDRRTLLLFFILLHSQHLASSSDIDGQQRIAQFKQEASVEFEKYIAQQLTTAGYSCLPPSTNIAGRDYDVLSFSESNHQILLIETKFRDPAPSSFSAKTLIEQEFISEPDGLLPQVIKHQERYDLLFQKSDVFHIKLGLRDQMKDYDVKAYFVTKYTPLISSYGNVRVISERSYIDHELPRNPKIYKLEGFQFVWANRVF